MSVPDPRLVEQIRADSRLMVRELGFMQSTLAATDYPPSAVHALLEIGAHRDMTAGRLAEVLGLDKSSVSRMLRKLIGAGEIEERRSAADGRAKLLGLTEKGRTTLNAIHAYGRSQVVSALDCLGTEDRQMVAQGLAAYARALHARRLGGASGLADTIEIEQGYRPGAIGRIAEMHANFYSRHIGFGQFFESRVAADAAEFAGRLESSRNALWLAVHEGRIVGSVAIDGEDLGAGMAHLRWFIIDDGLRGAGVGRRLLNEAVAFCDSRGFSEIQLWTFRGLDAARRLYEAFGFVLAEESPGDQWGKTVTEQRFVRQLPQR